jgi:hypothetical protein
MTDQPNRKLFNNFTELIGDAVLFYEASQTTTIPRHRATNLKQTILLLVFALEAAANSLIFSLNFKGILEKRTERFSIIEKFQMFLEADARRETLDEKLESVKKIKEMISFRNQQVHPKISHQSLLINEDNTVWADYVTTSEILQLPTFYAFLQDSHARNCLRATDEFLEQYFLEWASLTPEATTDLLCHKMIFEGLTQWCFTSEEFKNSQERFRDLGLNLNYLEKNRFNTNFSVSKPSSQV